MKSLLKNRGIHLWKVVNTGCNRTLVCKITSYANLIDVDAKPKEEWNTLNHYLKSFKGSLI
ncbi:unnamed protein product [Musa hybrid cultivar]